MKMLAQAGIRTISADDLAHACIRRGKPGYRAIVKHFGKEILGSDRQIQRRALGKIVFADADQRRRLQNIIHPCVATKLKAYIRSHRSMMALDIPLLYEAGYERWMDTIAVVYCSPAEQVRRLIARNGLSRREALQRLSSQWPIARKRRLADVVLNNSGSRTELQRQVNYFLQKIKSA